MLKIFNCHSFDTEILDECTKDPQIYVPVGSGGYKSAYVVNSDADYEDNIFVIVSRRSETLDEIVKRICDIVGGDCSLFLAKEEQIADIDKAIRKLEDKKSKLREL